MFTKTASKNDTPKTTINCLDGRLGFEASIAGDDNMLDIRIFQN